MARKQVAIAKERAKSTKSAKMQNKSRSKTTKRSRNGAPKQLEEDDEPELLIAPDSSSDSEPFEAEEEEEEDADIVAAEEVNENDTDDDAEEEVEEEEEVEHVEEGESNNNKKNENENKNKNKKNKKKNENSKENGNVMETMSLWRFPMHRVSRIIKSEDPNVRISQEAVYLINKASEKFLQLFSMEAYACAFLDRKKTVAYKHLSSVVAKRRRFDFLSDFVPERLKAEDALKEMPSVETS